MNQTIQKAPWHLWVVGLVSLLWNGFGAYDYTQTQLRNVDYMTSAFEQMGVDVAAGMDYFDSFPIWADAFWAFGVWGAVAGSVLLLLRSRFAFPAFALSIVGLIVTTIFQYANPMPGDYDKTFPIVISVIIWVVTTALTLYARRMIAKGVLR